MTKSIEEKIRFVSDEILEKGNLDAVNEIFTTNYIVHTGGKDYKGAKTVRDFVGLLCSSISNLQVIDVTFLCQTNDTITWQRTLSGIHETDMMGIPPSGKKVEWRDMVITRFDGEKIAEE